MTAIVRSGFDIYEFLYAGFLPRKNEDRDRKLQRLARERRTVVIFETPYRLHPLLEACSVAMPDRKAYIGMNLTMPFETHHYGTFKELWLKFENVKLKSEFVIVMEANKEWIGPKPTADIDADYDDDDEEDDVTEEYEYPVKAHIKQIAGNNKKIITRPGGFKKEGGFNDRRSSGGSKFGGGGSKFGGSKFGPKKFDRRDSDRDKPDDFFAKKPMGESEGGFRKPSGFGDRRSSGGGRAESGSYDRKSSRDNEGGFRKEGGFSGKKFGSRSESGSYDRKPARDNEGGFRKEGGFSDKKFGGGGSRFGDKKFGDKKFGGDSFKKKEFGDSRSASHDSFDDFGNKRNSGGDKEGGFSGIKKPGSFEKKSFSGGNFGKRDFSDNRQSGERGSKPPSRFKGKGNDNFRGKR
jgi:hypothetical protein